MLNYQVKKWLQPSLIIGIALVACLATTLFADDTANPKQIVDFERHIAPLFGRLGCNSAACHGAFGGGKGGLQLSLFGHSSKMDFQELKDRIDLSTPESSLLLLKPSGREQHVGGVRFETASYTYQMVKKWIEEGAQWNEGSGRVKRLTVEPAQVVLSLASAPQTLAVTAEYFDGSQEVVTHLCQFTSRDEGIAVVEPNGRIARSHHGDTSVIVSYSNALASVSVLAPFPANSVSEPSSKSAEPTAIDLRIEEKLALLNIVPSGPSSDEEFLRRVTLDTIGTIPTPGQVIQFVSSSVADKREQKIDELLNHPMHAALWATRMCDITKCDVSVLGEDGLAGTRRAQMWHDWFRRRFVQNASYADIVRGIVTATSREGQDVLEWIKQEEQFVHRSRESFDNDYASRQTLDLFWRREFRDSDARLKENAELIAVAFTGVRLNCAQCHKHPFDRWTQDDFASFANIFSRVIYGSSDETNSAVLAELASRRNAKLAGEKVISLPRIREVFLSGELGRTLSGSQPGNDVSPRAFDSAKLDQNGDMRQQFFDWLVAAENPYFARSFANRVWATYFGIGLVDPVDDLSGTNPPSHPRLLNELAQCFRESNFDIRAMEKRILMSAAYQRSASWNESNRDDRRNFARQYVRPLLAEVALDALNKALGTRENFGDSARAEALAIEVGTNKLFGDAGRALQVFGRGKREATCDCNRRTESDLRQFIYLANDRSVIEKIKTGTIRELLALNDPELIRTLYLRALGRTPEGDESEIALEHLRVTENREKSFDDLVWALVNSREFLSNH